MAKIVDKAVACLIDLAIASRSLDMALTWLRLGEGIDKQPKRIYLHES